MSHTYVKKLESEIDGLVKAAVEDYIKMVKQTASVEIDADLDELFAEFWPKFSCASLLVKEKPKKEKAPKPAKEAPAKEAPAPGEKKGPSDYQLFRTQKTAELKEQFPHMSGKDRAAQISEAWKAQKATATA